MFTVRDGSSYLIFSFNLTKIIYATLKLIELFLNFVVVGHVVFNQLLIMLITSSANLSLPFQPCFFTSLFLIYCLVQLPFLKPKILSMKLM